MSPREIQAFHALHQAVLRTRPDPAEPEPADSLLDRVLFLIPLLMVVALCTLVACVAIVPPIAP